MWRVKKNCATVELSTGKSPKKKFEENASMEVNFRSGKAVMTTRDPPSIEKKTESAGFTSIFPSDVGCEGIDEQEREIK